MVWKKDLKRAGISPVRAWRHTKDMGVTTVGNIIEDDSASTSSTLE